MSAISTTVFLFLFCLHEGSLSEREHKVHNIVLYPEKHSWCQITPIQQVVGSPGFDPVTIDNNVCVGACYSYSIPKTQPAEPGELIGPYCDSCQPSDIECYHVNLKQTTKNGEEPTLLQKKVQIITNCTCQSCDGIKQDRCDVTSGDTLELPGHLFTEEKSASKTVADDLPELLEAHHHHTKDNLKFKNKLKKWFETYQGKNDENLMRISEDLEALPNSFKVEEPSLDHMKIQLNDNVVVLEDSEKKRKEPKPTRAEEHHHNHRHHLGEEQQIGESIVHLIKGPHGSMVAAPVEAKLHIDSDDLKPNSEGIVINYQNHNYKQQQQQEDQDVPEM